MKYISGVVSSMLFVTKYEDHDGFFFHVFVRNKMRQITSLKIFLKF